MRILFGVFDWGLGHATRDIPLIDALLARKHTVHIVSTGRALTLLRERYGSAITFHDVPSIKPPYPKHRFFQLAFTMHIPSMVYTLHKSRSAVETLAREQRFDRVISDCRYDVYDTPQNSYFSNHQVRFASNGIIEPITEWWLAKRQQRYAKILVPDYAHNSLTGRLSHELRFLPARRLLYLGILSQAVRTPTAKKDIDLFVSISGPEPQRTELENILLPQLKAIRKKRIVVTLGTPERAGTKTLGNITLHGFLSAQEQARMLNRAKLVITRSGYTTLMELAELRVPHALLIPTPGQTEQVLLAERFEASGWCPSVSQYGLDLNQALKRTSNYCGIPCQWPTKKSVKRFLQATKT